MFDTLTERYSDLLSASPQLQARLATVLQQLEQQAQQQLHDDDPLQTVQQQLQAAQTDLQQTELSAAQLQQHWQHYQQFLQAQQLPHNQRFWHSQLNRDHGDPRHYRMLLRLLTQQWQQQLSQRQQQWQIQQLILIRQQQWHALQQWLQLLARLSRDLTALGLEPGLLVDFSNGRLQPQQIGQIEQWAKLLQQQPQLLALCQQLGKQRKASVSQQIEWLPQRQRRWQNQANAPAKEELFGLTLGRELAYLLPAELAQLADADLAALFDLKYAEQRLSQFELKGWQTEPSYLTVTIPHSVAVEDQLGPMILCIDSSLSMQGAPELIAKAVALYLAGTALAQRRDCYLINFSTQIDTLQLDPSAGLEPLLAFLQRSFNGGTDITPALRHGLALLEQAEFQHADLLLISDFVMTELDGELQQRIAQQHQQHNRCYGLAIAAIDGPLPLNLHLAKQWHYDPVSGAIERQSQQKQSPPAPLALEGLA
ncbi:vWA domain-containing protein [Ferrimonas senticii]|uniref:vWA domain-containing protein n=1 Tax=Ferrimonas senticii TaxID=394566 RepID=UPI000426DE62|nr:VWA domain-containing protein [Ferrimonas senticii]